MILISIKIKKDGNKEKRNDLKTKHTSTYERQEYKILSQQSNTMARCIITELHQKDITKNGQDS